jgi:putative serine protease PepD
MSDDTKVLPTAPGQPPTGGPADDTAERPVVPGFPPRPPSSLDFPPPSAPHAPPPPPVAPAAPIDPAPRAPRRGVATLVAVALAAGLVGGAAGAGAVALMDGSETASSVSSLDRPAGRSTGATSSLGSVDAVADKVLPSVVNITVTGGGGSGTGTGIVISSDGMILTNNHVVSVARGGGAITVTFSDGSTAAARIVGLDATTDLAVIQAEDVSDLTPATLGSSADLRVGDQVVAIGSPLGLEGTVTTGIVSALNRPVRTGDAASGDQSTVIDAIQTDAAINPGNSGGPLVDMAGNVVGINSAIATLGSSESGSIGLGFAIPVDQARRIAEELQGSGTATHARLGVTVGDAASETGLGQGAVLGSVEPGGAADEAGLRADDVVTRIDDRRVTDADSLIAAVRSYPPGTEVTVTYLRDGAEATASVTLGSDATTS